MESPKEIEFDILHRFEYSFKVRDDKGLFRTYKTLSCKFVILAKTAEEADECLKKEIYTAFIKTIEDLEDYKRYDSPITYSSGKWKQGLLYYDVDPVKPVNELYMKKDLFSLGACAFAVLIFLGLLLIFSAVICLLFGG